MASSFSARLERSASYHYRVSRLYQQQHQALENVNERPKLMATDGFKFYTNVISRSIDSNSIVRLTTLLYYCQDIGCKSFFQEGHDFLRSHLSHPNFPSESREQIIQRVIHDVRQLFQFDDSFASDPDDHGVGKLSDSHSHEFCLFLEIVVDTPDDANR